MKRPLRFLLLLLFLAGAGVGRGQRLRNGDGPIYYTEGGDAVDERTVRTAREIASHSTTAPKWSNPGGFPRDVFTFVRIIRDNDPQGAPTGGSWVTDFPDSDLNLSYRLHQVTSIKTDKDLFRYPFIYMVEPGGLLLRDEEVPILRRYLLNGGFLMADDFWGEWQWQCFAAQMKRVFPERKFVELPMEHPIFHCVFDIKGPKNSLQTPSLNIATDPVNRAAGITWERHLQQVGSLQECTEVHVRALSDDKGRIMVLATHNCDNGDGWEREGEDDWFFREFSEKRAFPLGINIIFWAMTH